MQVKESKGLVLKRDETKVRDIYKQGRMYFQQGWGICPLWILEKMDFDYYL